MSYAYTTFWSRDVTLDHSCDLACFFTSHSLTQNASLPLQVWRPVSHSHEHHLLVGVSSVARMLPMRRCPTWTVFNSNRKDQHITSPSTCVFIDLNDAIA